MKLQTKVWFIFLGQSRPLQWSSIQSSKTKTTAIALTNYNEVSNAMNQSEFEAKF